MMARPGPIAGYRLYRLNRAGRILSATEIVCAADGEAIDAAKALADGGKMELWNGARIVKVFDPATPRSPR